MCTSFVYIGMAYSVPNIRLHALSIWWQTCGGGGTTHKHCAMLRYTYAVNWRSRSHFLSTWVPICRHGQQVILHLGSFLVPVLLCFAFWWQNHCPDPLWGKDQHVYCTLLVGHCTHVQEIKGLVPTSLAHIQLNVISHIFDNYVEYSFWLANNLLMVQKTNSQSGISIVLSINMVPYVHTIEQLLHSKQPVNSQYRW